MGFKGGLEKRLKIKIDKGHNISVVVLVENYSRYMLSVKKGDKSDDKRKIYTIVFSSLICRNKRNRYIQSLPARQ